jgi:glutathione peroxidase
MTLSAPIVATALGLALAATLVALPPPARAQSAAPAAAPACPPLLRHTFGRLQDDQPQPLCQYAGKVLLVVNTASYCGYTGQYEGLEALHARYAARGLVVMGFPSNDFNQESDDKAKIAELCFNTYGVKFPMFAPSQVTGRDANALFAGLAHATGQPPKWNFHKYVVDRRGQPVAAFASRVTPGDAALVAAIEKALAQR